MNVAHETHLEHLRQKATVLLRENEILTAELVKARRRILELEGRTPEQLQQELELLDRQIARAAAALEAKGRAIEDQADPENASPKDEKDKKERKPRSKFGPKPQPNLEVKEQVHDLDDADKMCAACGGGLRHWEGQDDETEEIDVIERRFVIKKHVRKKYRCKCGCVDMPDMPPRLVPGGRYSNDFAVEVASMKYVDQLPLERIARIFGREGLDVDSQTLWDQVDALARKLKPAWSRLRDEALKEACVGLDQTSWKVIGHEKIWQMWELSTPRIAYFDIAETKGEDDGKRVLEGFTGTVMCDAFSTHGALAKSLPGILLAHCWAHVRHKLDDVEASDPIRSDQLIGFVKELYDVEEQAGDDIEKRRVLRDTLSRGVLKRLREWRLEQRPLPSSPMGKLLSYLDRNEAGFKRFLDDPRIPLDNNLTERGYLWVAVGRRSYVGSRSKRGTEAAAIFYSLAESARRSGVDPKAYFRRALAAALEGRQIPLPHELVRPAESPGPT